MSCFSRLVKDLFEFTFHMLTHHPKDTDDTHANSQVISPFLLRIPRLNHQPAPTQPGCDLVLPAPRSHAGGASPEGYLPMGIGRL